MKFAILATTLLALLLTSTCIASPLQSNHEDDGGYSNVLVKRFSSESSSESSPPTPPHLGLRRGNPDALVQRFREEQEREKRKQAAAGASSSKWSTSRTSVHLAKKGLNRGDIAWSDDSFDQPNDEETDDEETESDPWITRWRESALGHNDVSMSVMSGRRHVGIAARSSGVPSGTKREPFKRVPSVHESTSTSSSSSSRPPSATHAIISPSWERQAHALLASHASVTPSDTRRKAVNPRKKRTSSSMRSPSVNHSALEAAPSAYWETPAHSHARASSSPSMSDAVDETALGVRKKQQRQQKCTEIVAKKVVLKKATFLDILRAREPFYQPPKKLTAEEKERYLSAKSSQDLIDLALLIHNKISLTPAQKVMLKSDGRFEEYQRLRKARFRQTKIQTAMGREKRRRRFEKRGLFNAPLSYRALEPEDLKELWQRLKKLVKNIEAIKKGDNGKKWQLVKLWTQEDSEWWKGYIEFRQKAEAAVPRVERLVHAIDTFFANGKGKKKMPAALENTVSGGFRPPEAYQEALVARRKALRNTVQAMVA